MSIEFDTDQNQNKFNSISNNSNSNTSSMANWLLKNGIIKEESQADTVLIAFVIFNFIIADILFYYFVF